VKPLNPEYFLLNVTAARTASRISPEECQRWVAAIVKNFDGFVADRNYEPSFSDDLVGDMTRAAWMTQRAGLQALIDKREANPSGKAKSDGNPMGGPMGGPMASQIKNKIKEIDFTKYADGETR